MAKVDEAYRHRSTSMDGAIRDFLDTRVAASARCSRSWRSCAPTTRWRTRSSTACKNAIQNMTQAVERAGRHRPPEGQDPYPDQGLPGDGGASGDPPHPDQTLPGDLPPQQGG